MIAEDLAKQLGCSRRNRERLNTISRKLTITASDQYGLPTAPDDEILLGLLQLSRIQNVYCT
jgi:hypothetical protein